MAYMARAVSMPIPDDAPVIRTTLSCQAWMRLLSCRTCMAVGRLSPGPLAFLCCSAYGLKGEDILIEREMEEVELVLFE